MINVLAKTEMSQHLKKARNYKSKVYSDVIDSKGNQYVDLVQEGGGMLGIALVGYVHILEEAGIRFRNLAGTSAGAINTTFMASLGSISEAKAEKLLDLLSTQKFSDFIDGDSNSKALIACAINELGKEKENSFMGRIKQFFTVVNFAIRTLRARKSIFKRFGLNPGNKIQDWIETTLNENGITSLKTLKELMQRDLDDLRIRPERKEPANPHFNIKISLTAADITTRSGVFFPEMAKLYFENPNEVHPAVFARASLSIPIFYKPLEVKNIPNAGKMANAHWINSLGYYGAIPESVKFVDGAVISNFPLEAFHVRHMVPRLPTFGVKLGVEREKLYTNNKMLDFISSLFDTASNYSDLNFILRNPDAKSLVQIIDIGDHNWLDFNMDEKEQVDLYLRGAKAAIQFLERFDWKEYREERKIEIMRREVPQKIVAESFEKHSKKA